MNTGNKTIYYKVWSETAGTEHILRFRVGKKYCEAYNKYKQEWEFVEFITCEESTIASLWPCWKELSEDELLIELIK